ncbi:uncharacterized protein BDV14DRAFT_184338 [Aspergillus stella-maris]|uniref:uncharacterized protein n=1 Tax=Aspergillus stella-maris TaxID=1810926 RepID=UPI003CCDB5DF
MLQVLARRALTAAAVVAATTSLAPAAAALDHSSGSASAPVFSVTQSDWDAFNASVSGRLHDGIPMLSPCFADFNGVEQNPDTEACSTIQSNRQNHTFISTHFSGYQESNWAGCASTGENCALGKDIPDLKTPLVRSCKQGSVPRRYVDARDVEDVKRTLAFARERGLRLVVKNTGHDYRGRSSAPDAFALWTHNIQSPIELTKQFVPDECTEDVGDVITFGAGQQFGGVYEFANAHGYRVVGGTSPSVGIAGGWTAGGGHSMLSNELGLGVDNVQQIRAVLPNGEYITANRCQNQDIFFALRGGGGGTFGVVMEMSYSVHPKRPMQFARVSIGGVDEGVIEEFLSIVVGNAERWASEGWGGYIIPAAVGGVSTFSMGTTMLDLDEAKASIKPLFDLANRSVDSGTLGNATVMTADYHNILQAVITREETLIFPGSAFAFSSRLIPRESFDADNQQQLSSTLHDILTTAQKQKTDASSNLLIYAVAPSLYSRTMPESDLPGGAGASSITPAWRNGLWHVIFTQQFEGTTTDPSAVQNIWQTTHEIMNPLRDITPTGGAYQNEADPFEPNPTDSFWGIENYEKLLRIKKEVDPTNLLTVHGGIGWDETDERYKCYPNIEV